jgi:hypothetical protein
MIPATVAAGPAAGVSVGTQPEYTRIVIPFGRIFMEVCESGLQKVFPNSVTCSDASSEQEKLRMAAPEHVVRLRVQEFRVWEEPLNHINLSAAVECRVYQASSTNEPTYGYEVHHQVIRKSIGSVMTSSSGFIRAMNKISNKFADDLSEEILEKLQKAFTE